MLPLEGIKVLDLTNLLPGPFSTMIFAELGAEVIKVERPGIGDGAREVAGLFEAINRGKKSITLDLKNNEDKKKLSALIEESDVMIEGFRPGVMERLGFLKDKVKTINPRIIYCSISGYGQEGPYRNLPGHDINYLAVSGILSISGDPKGKPEAAGGIQVADLGSAMYAVNSVLAALLLREKTNEGTYIDVSMTDCALSLMAPRINEYVNRNNPSKQNFMGRGAYGAYKTKDNKYIAIGCVEEHFWHKLCDVLNVEKLKSNKKFEGWHNRMEHADEINAILNKKFLLKNRSEWLELMIIEDIPCAPVNFIEELLEDPHLAYRGIIKKDENSDNLIITHPVKFTSFEVRSNSDVPTVGEHNSLIKNPL
ncbi:MULTISPECIES: CaiB/BaiF CoA-transferase family protein [Sporosarcina]|uniref:CaiB/BaiF CoA transferase family protein n=1 Tax=Sporosarcina TaxID=1569 RepID=UPI000A16C346|nr:MULTISPECIES: CaiB/BaiF CoA-transferase family protein [Sporosarcina]ARJ39587.1 hypothetical protein SporoP8_12305 [Sporosarcina ureae]